MSKFVIIALTREQARHWINTKRRDDMLWAMNYPNQSDILIVTSPDHLRGFNVERGVLLDGWREIHNIRELLFLANIHTQGTNPALKKAYDEVEGKIRPTPKKATISGKTYNQLITDAAEYMANDIDNEVLKSLMKTTTL